MTRAPRRRLPGGGLRALAACAAALPLAGCVTSLEVRKVGNEPVDGIRYSLPVPVLEVCPGADGSIAVNERYLPDGAATYAIAAAAYGGKLDLDVTVVDGLLTRLAWNPDSTAVVEDLATSAGKLAALQVDSGAKAAAAEEKAAAAAAQAREDALAKAGEAVFAAQNRLAVALAALETLRTLGGTSAQLLGAEVEVARARAELDNAMRARERLLAPPAAGGVAGGRRMAGDAEAGEGDAADSEARDGDAAFAAGEHDRRPPAQPRGGGSDEGDQAPAGFATAWGCAFYVVVDDGATVELRPFSPGQQRFETSTRRDKPKPSPLPATPAFQPEGSRVVRPRGKPVELTLQVAASVPVDAVAVEAFSRRQADGTWRDLGETEWPALTPGKAGFRVDLPDDLPAGRYLLEFAYASPNRPRGSGEVELEIRR